eukprot:TRINITY_DN90326_c0_g1_i1.p1 TRINITY_DN90326_c0_g1~~TRINITY_DN90326_c0_g1_i1.p1  ORF type:complete len:212 (-),score=13.80 TRINITY_DN90326_c0_g1_i1:138-773(-)
MAMAIASRQSAVASHGGPGSRKGHDFEYQSQTAPLRSSSLPGLGVPAGYSASLGNRLGLAAYTNLRGRFHARLGVPEHCPAPRKPTTAHQIRMDTSWFAPQRLDPATLPAAGVLKEFPRGKRMLPDNMNTMSHVDTLLFGIDTDGSDGLLPKAEKDMFAGRAGLNAALDRTPVYGHSPPHCVRTFGETGTTGWENPRGNYHRPQEHRTIPQ